MSKNITVQEGGIAKQMTVDKLKTNLVGGGTQLWVPEDSVEQTTKSIAANGTYRASDDGYYGYSEVTVNVPGGAGGPPGGRGSSIVGKDGDGDDAIVTVNPETGELEEEKLPNHIYVVTPPYNPRGIYADGETIDVGPDSGFEVVALLVDGAPYEAPGYPMGHIPLSELTVEPTVAVYDESTDTGGYDEATSALVTEPVLCDTSWEYVDNLGGHVKMSFVKGSGYIAHNGGTAIIASPDQDAEFYVFPVYRDSYTHDGKTVYYTGHGNASYREPISPPNTDISSNTQGEIAWTMVYGEHNRIHAGSHQTINVSWPRPGDGQVLETTFEILVGPSPSGDDDN